MNIKLLAGLATAIIASPAFSTPDPTPPFSPDLRGIQIIPLKEMNIPQSFKKQVMMNFSSEKAKGYESTTESNEHVKFLLQLPQKGPLEIAEFKNEIGDAHLKANASDLKLAFKFNKVNAIKKENIIGYTASGGYHQEGGKNLGWDGVGMFFTDKELGVCSYTIMKIQAVQLVKETVEYTVNKKPSDSIVQGNYGIGFLYNITWYTNNTMNYVECANVAFSKDIKDKVITLANKLDSEQGSYIELK